MRFLTLAALFFVPHTASAQLIKCGGRDQPQCQSCDVIGVVNDGIQLLIIILLVLAGLLFIYAGYLMVVSAGNESNVTRAKGIFTNVLVGILIVLGSWLAIDTFMKALIPGGNVSGCGPWNTIQCVEQPGLLEFTPDPLPNRASEGCPDCVEFTSFVACKAGANCTVSAQYAESLQGVIIGFSETMEVTEGYPPTRGHSNSCHSNGTCVDIVFQDRNWTSERIQSFQSQASANGCRAVYEPDRGGSCLGANPCYQHPDIEGSHFSLYCN